MLKKKKKLLLIILKFFSHQLELFMRNFLLNSQIIKVKLKKDIKKFLMYINSLKKQNNLKITSLLSITTLND